MKAFVTNIEYDTDGEIVDLPTELTINIPTDEYEVDEYEEFISDEISNITEYCVLSFSVEYK